MRRLICQRVCAVEGVAAHCSVRVSGGHYNIEPDCSFSNGVITILFELIRDATRLRYGRRPDQEKTPTMEAKMDKAVIKDTERGEELTLTDLSGRIRKPEKSRGNRG